MYNTPVMISENVLIIIYGRGSYHILFVFVRYIYNIYGIYYYISVGRVPYASYGEYIILYIVIYYIN